MSKGPNFVSSERLVCEANLRAFHCSTTGKPVSSIPGGRQPASTSLSIAASRSKFALLIAGQMSKSSVVRGEPRIRSAMPPRMMKRTSCRTSASRSARGRSAPARGSDPPSEEPLSPRPTRRLSRRREELALLLQTVEALFDRQREHLADQPFVVIVVRDELDLQVEARAAHEPLETSEARLLAPAFDPGDLRLRHSGALGERPLGEPRARPYLANQRPRTHS